MDAHPAAQRDDAGRAFVPWSEVVGASGALDLRAYRCPVAQAREVNVSGLPALYASTQGGLPVSALGADVLSSGAVDAVAEMRAAWGWREKVHHDVAEARRRAQARGTR